jgi:hypothetical protein
MQPVSEIEMRHLRLHRRGLAAFTASLFLAVWASMALAPCLMAAQPIIGSDCPHCPEPPPPCHDPGGAGVCTYVDGYDFDGRVPAMPKVEVELVLAPPMALAAAVLPAAGVPVPAHRVRAPPDPGGPRLHLRNCVLND